MAGPATTWSRWRDGSTASSRPWHRVAAASGTRLRGAEHFVESDDPLGAIHGSSRAQMVSITQTVGVSGQRRWWCAALICVVATGVFAVFMVLNPLGDRFHRMAGRHRRRSGRGHRRRVLRLGSSRDLRAGYASRGACSGRRPLRGRSARAIWCWYQLARDVQVPFPSLADLFFLLAVPLMAAGVVLLAEESGAIARSLRVLLDGAIIAGSLLFVSWATALGTVLNSGGEGEFARIVGSRVSGRGRDHRDRGRSRR